MSEIAPEEGLMASQQPPKQQPSRAQPVKQGHLPVSEFAFDRAGAASPFGDDITFPVSTDSLTYRHPTEE